MIGSREEAETLVRACRYPPEGARSYGPIAGAFGRGRDQTEAANAAVHVFAMIETAEGLSNVDAIASTPGLDGLFAGPTDLGLSLGLAAPGDLTAPELLGHLDAIVEAARRHGIVAGVHAPDPPRAADMAGRGFRLISCAVDVELLREAGAEALRAARRPSR
jgi:4-hydroxy-2-oxoheptanedioate aldolase